MILKQNQKANKTVIILVLFSAFFLNLNFIDEKVIFIDNTEKYYKFIQQNNTNYVKVCIDVSDIKYKNKSHLFEFNKNDSFINKLILNKNLVELKIAFTELNDSENKIFELKKIKKLELISCKITKVNSKIKKLKNLEYLNLFANRIKKIENLENNKKLKELILGGNVISEFSKKSLNLVKLKYLDLNNNKIKVLPQYFDQLKSLTTLKLDNNLIDSVPNSLLKLNKLRTFSIINNKLKEIPFFLSNPNKDEFYDFQFSKNQIQTIPCFISKYKHLELFITGNEIEFLPDCFCKEFDYLEIKGPLNLKIPKCLEERNSKNIKIFINSNHYY
jgi:hypothetical protein